MQIQAETQTISKYTFTFTQTTQTSLFTLKGSVCGTTKPSTQNLIKCLPCTIQTTLFTLGMALWYH